jgi:hypothetical protein
VNIHREVSHAKNVDTIHREKYVKNRSFSDFYHFFFVEDDEGRVCLRAREREIIMTNIRKYIESKRSYRLCYRCYLRMMNTS